jgi:hypothetical protein
VDPIQRPGAFAKAFLVGEVVIGYLALVEFELLEQGAEMVLSGNTMADGVAKIISCFEFDDFIYREASAKSVRLLVKSSPDLS